MEVLFIKKKKKERKKSRDKVFLLSRVNVTALLLRGKKP